MNAAPPVAPAPQAKPPANAPVVPPPPIEPLAPPTAADLVKRAAADKLPTPPDKPPVDGSADTKIKFDLEAIKDPTQRAFFEGKLKEAERGINERFMSLADQRKALDAEKAKLNVPWTQDRVQTLMKDPNFVQAAHAAVQAQAQIRPPSNWEGSTDQWSALSEEEQGQFRTLETKVNTLLANQEAMLNTQEHEHVKTRFPDYDPAVVDAFQRDVVVPGKVSPLHLKELIWKAINFDRYVENSYKYGLQDRNGSIQEKIGGASMAPGGGPSVEPSDKDKPTQLDGERRGQFFVRLAEWNRRQRR